MAEAVATILSAVRTVGSETVVLRQALDRVLSEEVTSPLALPPWDNSSMDGYAVHAADVRGARESNPVELPVVATIAAGAVTHTRLERGQAVRIMTGAPVPGGADSVVRVEDTDGGNSTVRVRSDRDAGRNIRLRGEDVAEGALVAAPGSRISPALLGVLASVGRAELRVFRRVRVAVLASGDELVDVDEFEEVLGGRRIVSSNSYTLEALLRSDGAQPVPLGVVRDDPAEMRQRILDCDADMLITSGGVSVGAYDFTRSVLAELGARVDFWRARIRPGAPIGFGELGDRPWLGLPGNPVSAMVTYELFVRPAIRRMQGRRLIHRQTVPAVVSESISIAAPLTHFLRAVVTATQGGYVARLTGPQGSGMLSSMASANALLVIPSERQLVQKGETVQALLLHDEALHGETSPL